MPPKKKQDVSKKSVQKKKDQIIEDKTFGLKNKNKSKKVQQQIQAVVRNVQNSGDPKMRKLEEQRKQAKAEAKARKKAAEEERNALFGEALLAVQKKTTVATKGIDEAKGRDHDDGKEKSGTSRAMKMMFQMDAKEMEEALTADPNYVRTLEDEVELQRQKKLEELQKSGKKGTPITEETFKLWLEKKRKAKQDAARKLVESELKKRKGGKGLSVLSGRELYDYKKELFVDDDDGDDTKNNGGESNSNTNDTPQLKDEDIAGVADKVQTDLFLDGDSDDDLDDISDD